MVSATDRCVTRSSSIDVCCARAASQCDALHMHNAAIAALRAQNREPDIIISDFHLSDGRSGLEAIAQVRTALSAGVRDR